ncbi:phosphoribosylformylglycinamidine cyclo-ligase [Pumilibacter muris]|uniref:phosphoribosylformylglycinamidine cyclo-ligase n=1 Tax=Pumilibacter muris TaxID=2941510 RepID=UPI00203D16B3|nr:phosphoribosylformylglycinamidine cyclo-ligase [Pumilibacter muris]
MDYKEAGVDVTAGYKAVELMKKHVKSTFDKNVLGGLGSFGGFYSIADYVGGEPVLVAGTDGVGTKLKYAFIADKHDTVGIDCVAMCVNDVVCQGAKPLLFLDYMAVGKLFPEQAEKIVSGVAEGCRQSECALIGGETAEMPGFYSVGEYDLAGFSVGIVDKKKAITGADIKAGDVLVGLRSSGIHSNGFSLVRKLFGEDKTALSVFQPKLGKTLLEEVLTPTRIYVKTVLELIKNHTVKGVAHITGGGFIENIPRIFPKGVGAEIDINSYDRLPVFDMLKEKSELPDSKLYNTFNMGIGLVLCVPKGTERDVMQAAEALGDKAYVIGKTVAGEGVTLLGAK